MQIKPHSPYLVSIPSSALVVFLGITFFITWGLIRVYIIVPEMAAATFDEFTGTHPFFFFATWSPAIAAFVVVFRYSGKPGIHAFISQLLLWRCSMGWTTFIQIILPLVFISGSLIKGGPVLNERLASGSLYDLELNIIQSSLVDVNINYLFLLAYGDRNELFRHRH